MKLVEKVMEQDIYNKKVKVELTYGELVMLRAMSGETNSKNLSMAIESMGSIYTDFAKEVKSSYLNRELFNSLVQITNEVRNAE